MKLKITLVIGAVLCLTACDPNSYSGKFLNQDNPLQFGKNLPKLTSSQLNARYGSCDEFQSSMREMLNKRNAQLKKRRDQIPETGEQLPSVQAESTSTDATSRGAQTGEDVAHTNIQTTGVDEADYIKIGDHHIFTIASQSIEVNSRSSLEYLGRLSIAEGFEPHVMFTSDSRLWVISKNDQSTRVDRFTTSAENLPVADGDWLFEGHYHDARLFQQQKLVLAFNHPLVFTGAYSEWNNGQAWWPLDKPVPENPVKLNNNSTTVPLDCQQISSLHFDAYYHSLVKVVALDVEGADEWQQAAFLGSADHMYASSDSLYFSTGDLEVFQEEQGNDQRQATFIGSSWPNQVWISRFDIEGFVLASMLDQMVPGYAKDRWSFRELIQNNQRHLAIFTTDWDSKSQLVNHLHILTENQTQLTNTAFVKGFGATEDIRSVRFIGDWAYAVTFKKTDPLFAFDLSDATAPLLVGELKIPGFSTYLHPIAPGRLIGVGFDTEEQGNFALYRGLKVSLFDISNPREMRELDAKIFGERGSFSEVTTNPHAFFTDGDRFAIPATLFDYSTGGERRNDWQLADKLSFSGALFFAIENDKLALQQRISHQEWSQQHCSDSLPEGQWWENRVRSVDINRVFRLAGRYIGISRFGITDHGSGLNETVHHAFPEFSGSCLVALP